jgi:hypothetical protein
MLHFGPLYGLEMDSLSEAFLRVLALDPSHTEAQLHLPWAAGLDGRRGLIDTATSRMLAQDSTGYFAPVWRVLGAFARGDSAALAEAVGRDAGMDDLQRLLAVNMTATLRDPRATGRLALQLLAVPGRLPEVRAFGHVMAAHLELASGRLAAVERELAAARDLDSTVALEGRALLALHPLPATHDSALRSLRVRVEASSAGPAQARVAANPWVSPHDSLHPQVRLYLLGALSAVRHPHRPGRHRALHGEPGSRRGGVAAGALGPRAGGAVPGGAAGPLFQDLAARLQLPVPVAVVRALPEGRSARCPGP